MLSGLMNLATLHQQFIQRYGSGDASVRCFFAPGRVNLIGDHIDYHGGLVLPCAIVNGTALLVRSNADACLRLASLDMPTDTEISLNEPLQKHGDSWFNYPLGVVEQWQREHGKISGLDCLYSGNLPPAAGLSSSAAIEVVTAFALHNMPHTIDQAPPPDLPALAQLCQRAENQFVGVQCGIMDQYSSACGQREHAMLLNCETLACEHIPVQLGDYELVLINTNQARELSDSKYNERVSETRAALEILQTQLAIQQLTDVSPQTLERHATLLANEPVLLRRARHVVTEQARVQSAALALTQGHIDQFGELMYASHDSLDRDYAVSSDPLNTLVNLTRHNPSVLGARLTGAGFGGCTVNIVRADQTGKFMTDTAEQYHDKTGLQATFLRTTACDGVRELAMTTAELH